MERVDFTAADGNGAYYKLSAFLDMSSDRTKVSYAFAFNYVINAPEFSFRHFVMHVETTHTDTKRVFIVAW
jgi:hypothetical protein